MANLKRNDPCHCGSGKKYKKCHMKSDRARETFGGSDRDVTDVISADTIPYFYWKEWKSARMRGEYALLWQMLDPEGPYAKSFRDIDNFLLEAQKQPLPSGPEWAITKIKLDEKNAYVLSTRGEGDPTASDVKLELMHLIKTPEGWRLHDVETTAVDKTDDEIFVAFDEFGIESADYALHKRQLEGFERPDLSDYDVPDIEGGMDFFGRVQVKLNVSPGGEGSGEKPEIALGTVRIEDEGGDEAHEITQEELESIALRKRSMTLHGIAGIPLTVHASNSKYLTVQDVLDGIEAVESETRAKAEDDTGLNTHHVIFDGLTQTEDGTWVCMWGS